MGIGFLVIKNTTGVLSWKDATLQSTGSIDLSAECLVTEEIEYFHYTEGNDTWEPNNKYGIYVYAENDAFFKRAEELVNSNGGEWGYVLIPYNVKDLNVSKWQKVFENLRDDKVIPIIQLWDVDTDKYIEQTREAAAFLNKFVWPIKYRYVSVYNEPNDQKFWYGRVDPSEYARILDFTIKVFKEENSDFYMLNGALNVSAPTNAEHLDAFEYMRQMDKEVPGIFNKLDGWASHSYPQPNFSGDPLSTGRWSIRAYVEELEYLEDNLNLKKELPVFITETGWAHAEGDTYNSSFYSVDTISEFFKIAFEEVWNKDDRVRAVMPFTIRYDAPFDHFSWLNKDNVPYKHFDEVKSLKKVKGNPPVLKEATVKVSSCD